MPQSECMTSPAQPTTPMMNLVRNASLAVALAAVSIGSADAAEPSASPKHWQYAPTPPLGWNSWDIFGTSITEEQTRAQADAMAEMLLPAGYDVLTVDIQWYQPTAEGHSYEPGAELTTDSHSRLTPAVNRFPSAADGAGFKPLADYVHARGLRFGIHIMRGIPRQAVERDTPILGTDATAADIADRNSVCPWNPDMYGVDMAREGAQAYYDSIFQMYADWGVDYVKVDDISRPYNDFQKAEIEAIRKAIDKTGRPIVLSLSPGATPLRAGEHVAQHANLWRITDDFWDRWPLLYEMFERLDAWTPHRHEGAWPDADMLPIGFVDFGRPTNFTRDEQRTMMTLWSIGRSPLIFGGDMTRLDDFTMSMLTNGDVLAVNQNSENNRQISRDNDLIVWSADVPDSDDKYVALFNARDVGTVNADAAAFVSDVIRPQANAPAGGNAVDVRVPLGGASRLLLAVDDGGDGFDFDHAAWIEPRLEGPHGSLSLTKLRWEQATTGWGNVGLNETVEGRPLTLGAERLDGIGVHSKSLIEFDIPDGYETFVARGVLLPREDGNGSVRFLVQTDDGETSTGPGGEPVTVSFDDLGISGEANVRDLWFGEDLGSHSDRFTSSIPRHGASLYRISPVE